VAEIVPVGTLIDRGFPSYDFPVAPNGRFASNYLAYVKSRVQRGQAVERIRAGSNSQLALRGYHPIPAAAPFSIRNIAANGEVWTGNAEQTRNMFPPLSNAGGGRLSEREPVLDRAACGPWESSPTSPPAT
jgi:hypothetical protein